MEVENAVIPTAAKMEWFLSPDAGEPIFMVSLLKFRERAEYEDGRDSELTGHEAYQIHATEVARVIREVGGQLCFGADVTRLMVGAVWWAPSRNCGMKLPLPCTPPAKRCCK